ncbi:uncharacterized protein si:ch211-245h14.1 isoform X3 [Xiphias gladius]|uniref:uncharacterized protein si:ch211-245h14.1 isoform X3 n=1 Tax=Xiphias gladius TaxID=8245 RepID=UPI001A986D17|nr:uncharacterized protein si:ch211-245h14.1 isoform X3 [Xiphias gladius]
MKKVVVKLRSQRFFILVTANFSNVHFTSLLKSVIVRVAGSFLRCSRVSSGGIKEHQQKEQPMYSNNQVDVLRKELQGFISNESLRRTFSILHFTALTNSGVFVEYLHILMDIRTQVNNLQIVLDAYVGLPEDISKNQEGPEPEEGLSGTSNSTTCGPAPHKSQTGCHPQGAQGTGIADIMGQTMASSWLTGGSRQGSRDSLPGAGIADIIGQSMASSWLTGGSRQGSRDSITTLSRKEFREDSLPGTGIADIMGQTMASSWLTGGSRQGSRGSLPGTGIADIMGQTMASSWLTGGSRQGSRDSITTLSRKEFLEVTYQMVVGGETFDAHLQLMEQVKGHVLDGAQFIESSQDYQTIIVFCPISSRVGSDVEAVMKGVRDDKPVILVLMHHKREATYTPSAKKWAHVLLQVDVFYHETQPGLLKCQQNDEAVSEIRKELLKHSSQRCKYTSEGSLPGAGIPDNRGQTMASSWLTGGSRQGSRVMYEIVVGGETFDAHLQLMEQVKGHVLDGAQFIESSQDYQTIIVFCPISSRVGSDVKAVMKGVRDDKPVILVLMHHKREATYTPSAKKWADVLLQVDVFYHETQPGLLKCQQNDVAVSEIRKELLKHSSQRCKNTSEGMVCECGSASTGFGGNTGNEGLFSVWY